MDDLYREAKVPKSREISPVRRTWKAKQRLRRLYAQAKAGGNLAEWRRCKTVLDFLDGKTVVAISKELVQYAQ